VSGTIRKAEEEAIRQAKSLILAARQDTESSGLLLADAREEEQVMDVDDDSDD
jgi:ribonuclease P/MRP protein subunit POP5